MPVTPIRLAFRRAWHRIARARMWLDLALIRAGQAAERRQDRRAARAMLRAMS